MSTYKNDPVQANCPVRAKEHTSFGQERKFYSYRKQLRSEAYQKSALHWAL